MGYKQRYKNLLNTINQYNEGEVGITRIAYTNIEQTCIHAFMRLCKAENMSVRLDESGNLIARRDGKNNSLAPVVMGSHLDTVYQGGQLDGTYGVTAGLEVIRRLNDRNITTLHPIELIAFACEESARFGVSTVGSKAMVGMINKENYRNLTDRDGITMEEAFSLCALNFDEIDDASRLNEKFEVFLELHIEQGPVLINNNNKIGVVTGIAAPARYIINLSGKASHSGTTPMHMRQDALLGAAEIALQLEKAAKEELEFETVATVGVIELPAAGMNIVPGEVEIKVDIRSTSIESRSRVIEKMFAMIEQLHQSRDLKIVATEISMESPVTLSKDIGNKLVEICKTKNLPYQTMQSGAGHDAMNMTKLGPVGLIFVPSVDGLSHHPDEFTEMNDLLLGIDVLEEAIIQFAKI